MEWISDMQSVIGKSESIDFLIGELKIKYPEDDQIKLLSRFSQDLLGKLVVLKRTISLYS